MPTAFNLVPARFEDGRHLAIMEGLKAAGYEVRDLGDRRGQPPGDWLRPGDDRDVLVTWTVHRGPLEACRDFFRQHGGHVVVAEEAHIRRVPGGPYPRDQYFSLCLTDHQCFWRIGDRERWAAWNMEIKPWRRDGSKVLVREQRSIGSSAMASPPGWHTETAEALRRLTDRPVEVVTHPKTLKRQGKPVPRPEELFADAWCVVTWASHMGTLALLHGVPVIACAPRMFHSSVAAGELEAVNDPRMPDGRLSSFSNFAWAQWAMSEIRGGEAFKHLLWNPRRYL